MKKEKSIYWTIGTFTMLFIVFVSLSYAQEKTLEQLIGNSNLIIVGNVREIKSGWENANIWTYVTIDCSQILKGTAKTNRITIRSLGGKVGDISQIISGSPKFKVGETLLCFLKEDKKIEGVYYCIYGKFGKYTHEHENWIQNNSKRSESFIAKIKSLVASK